MNRLGGFAAGAVLAAVLAGGCGSSGNAVNTGPFGGKGFTVGQECVPIRAGELVTDGENEVRDSARATAVIDKVGLVSPHGLQLQNAYAVPATGVLYGVMHGYPSPGLMPSGFQWGKRQETDGARVPRGQVTDLILVLRTSGSRATDRGINVWYQVGSQHYHLRTGVGLLALVARTCPS